MVSASIDDHWLNEYVGLQIGDFKKMIFGDYISQDPDKN